MKEVTLVGASRLVIIRPDLADIELDPGRPITFGGPYCRAGDTLYECTEAVVEAGGTMWLALQWRREIGSDGYWQPMHWASEEIQHRQKIIARRPWLLLAVRLPEG